LYPTEAGTTAQTNKMQDKTVTIAERFSDAGYHTGAVLQNSWLSRECGFDQGFDDYIELWRSENQRPGDGNQGLESTVPVDIAREWIQARASESTPFFMFINFNVPHLPLRPPLRLRRRFLRKLYDPKRMRRVMEMMGGWGHLAGVVHLDEEDFDLMRDLYAAEVAFVDEWVGMLDDTLMRAGISDNTLVVITADHGENLGERGMIGHQLSMFDTTLHVPLIIRDPKTTAPNAVVTELTSLVDLAPTILRRCNIAIPEDSQLAGRVDLLAVKPPLTSAVYAEESRSPLFCETMTTRYRDFDPKTIDYALRSVRTPRYRLTIRDGRGIELYDLDMEVHEQRNIADEQPEITAQLRGDLEAWFAGLDAFEGASTFDIDDTETLRSLEALGYLSTSKKE
jgi:arylsulfatase A-like enzyme